MSGDDSDSAAPFGSAKALKPGPVVARETTGTIRFTVDNASALAKTDVHSQSDQKSIGGLLWKVGASKAPAPADPAKSALLVNLYAMHPTLRFSNWVAIVKASISLRAPPGTERQPIHCAFTASYGDWKERGTDKKKFLADWAVVESDDEGYIDTKNNTLSLGCTIEITKVFGVRPPLKALFNEGDAGFSDVCLVAGGRKLFFHSFMSLHSEVLSTMLMGGFVEGEMKEIELPGVDPDGFEAFLNLIYQVNLEVEVDDLEKVLAVADRFCADQIIVKCAKKLMSDNTGLPIAKRLLISDRFSLPEFYDILERAATTTQEMMALVQTEDGPKLSDRANSAILRRMVRLPLARSPPPAYQPPHARLYVPQMDDDEEQSDDYDW